MLKDRAKVFVLCGYSFWSSLSQIRSVECTLFDENVTALDFESSKSVHYNMACIGGTFDCLHPGHRILLTLASLVCDKLIIGVFLEQNRFPSSSRPTPCSNPRRSMNSFSLTKLVRRWFSTFCARSSCFPHFRIESLRVWKWRFLPSPISTVPPW